MTTIYTENFDTPTAPALPSGWSSATNGTVTTSTTQARSGVNSLALQGASGGGYAWGWRSGQDGPVGGTWAEAYVYPVLSSTYCDFYMQLRAKAQTGTGQSLVDGLLYDIDFKTGTSVIKLYYGGGFNSSLSTKATGGTFSSQWYRIIATIQESITGRGNSVGFNVAHAIQRVSDGYWLHHSLGWVNSGTMLLANAGQCSYNSTDRRYWYGSTPKTTDTRLLVGAYTTTSNVVYVDNVTFQSYPDPMAQQTWTPGTSVEFLPATPTGDGSTASAGALSNINSGSFSNGYAAGLTPNGYVVFDLGASVTGMVTRCHYSPYPVAGSTIDRYPMRGYRIETSASTAGPWTQVAALPPNAVRKYELTPVPCASSTAARYVRLSTIDGDYLGLTQLLIEGQITTGTPNYRPVRPTITPGSGRYSAASGPAITITTPTSGASIYYTTDGTTPTTSSTLYTGSIAYPSIAKGGNNSYTIKAVAYLAGATTTLSAVTTAVFYPDEFVPDTGSALGVVAANTGLNDGITPTFSTPTHWPQNWYDSTGALLYINAGDITYDSVLGLYVWIGGSYNTLPSANDAPLGHWLSTSSDLLNWSPQVQILPPAPYTSAGGALATPTYRGSQTRAGHIINASPVDPNKKHVLLIHTSTPGSGQVAVATAPTSLGPWTWADYPLDTPMGANGPGDSKTFYDPTSGSWYFIYNDAPSNGMWLSKMDPATDCTTFADTTNVNGSPSNTADNVNNFRIHPTGDLEAPQMFWHSGYYYVIISASTPYGGTNSQERYKSATTLAGLSAASLSSIWSGSPATSDVAYSAQGFSVFRPQGRKGWILACEVMDANENTTGLNPNNSHDRSAWYPLPDSAISGGVLSVQRLTSWDLSSLPLVASAHCHASLFTFSSLTGAY